MDNENTNTNVETAEVSGSKVAEAVASAVAEEAPATQEKMDDEKIAGIVEAKVNNILEKIYKQQGLTADDAKTAIAEYKARQKEKEPDVTGLNETIDGLKKSIDEKDEQIKQYMISSAVVGMVDDLGIDVSTAEEIMPYVVTNSTLVNDGKVDKEGLKKAFNDFLEKHPRFKKEIKENGFVGQVGVGQQKQAKQKAQVRTSLDALRNL